MRLRGNHDRFALRQNRGASSRLGITGTQMGVIFDFSAEQSFRIGRRHPAALLRDTDGHHFIFVFVDGGEDRRGRQQGDFVLSAASAK